MDPNTRVRGRRLAVILATIAIAIGIAAIAVDLVQGTGFNPRPLGAVVVGLVVIASVLGNTRT